MKKKTVITTERREIWVIRQASGEGSSGDVTEKGIDDTECLLNSIAMPSDEGVETDGLSDEQNLEP